MNCPRCNHGLDLIMKNKQIINSDNSTKITTEYYCTKCKSALVESFIDGDHSYSEWIDFNV